MRTALWIRSALLGIITLSLLLNGCASSTSRPRRSPEWLSRSTRPYPQQRVARPTHRPQARQSAVASWYGPGFHGRPTASGEIYNQNALTAAHPTLPLGSQVEVTNPANGKSVHVRINDRGPFIRGRSIDLSRQAARELGIIKPGVSRVRIKRLSTRRIERSRAATKRSPSNPTERAKRVSRPPAIQDASLGKVF